MTEIVKQEDLINKVSEQFRPYILALRTQNIKTGSDADNLKAIYSSLIKASAISGYSKIEDTGANKFITEKFYEQVKVKYPFATYGEIDLAFTKGALKEYGEYFGINVQTVWNWFKKYMESPELLNSKREWVNLIELPKSGKPVIDLKTEMKEPILNAYKDFLTNGSMPFTAPSFYTLICKIKDVKTLISSKEDRVKIREEAFKNYRDKLIKDKQHIKNKSIFDELLDYALGGKNPSYDTEARRVALKYYFNECKIKGVEPL